MFDCEGMVCTVMPGCSVFWGEKNGIKYNVKVFVPQNDVCECWLVEITDVSGTERQLSLHAQQTWSFHVYLGGIGTKAPSKNTQTSITEHAIIAKADDVGRPFYTMYGGFSMNGHIKCSVISECEETLITAKSASPEYEDFYFHIADIESDIVLKPGETVKRTVVSSASTEESGQ